MRWTTKVMLRVLRSIRRSKGGRGVIGGQRKNLMHVVQRNSSRSWLAVANLISASASFAIPLSHKLIFFLLIFFLNSGMVRELAVFFFWNAYPPHHTTAVHSSCLIPVVCAEMNAASHLRPDLDILPLSAGRAPCVSGTQIKQNQRSAQTPASKSS